MRAVIECARLTAVLTLVSLLLGAHMEAQGRPKVTASPDTLLARFIRDFGGDGALPPSAGSDIAGVLLSRAEYPVASLDAVIDGLEKIALGQGPPQLRQSAVSYLAMSGSRGALHPRRGTTARLMQIYQRSSHPWVRAAVVSRLARSAEQQDALCVPGAGCGHGTARVSRSLAGGPDGHRLARRRWDRHAASSASGEGRSRPLCAPMAGERVEKRVPCTLIRVV